MKKLKEYLTVASSLSFENAVQILGAGINKVQAEFDILSSEKQAVAAQRLEKCLKCPFNSSNAKTGSEYLELTGGHYETEREDHHCTLCKCNTSFKVFAFDADCGATVWNARNPEKPLEVQWHKIEN